MVDTGGVEGDPAGADDGDGVTAVEEVRWFVARTNIRQETLALASLRAADLVAYLPLLPKTNRKGEIYAAPLFPSFLFVQLVLGAIGWTKVFSARGVSSVLGSCGRPTALPEAIVRQIHYREAESFADHGLIAPARPFAKGEIVRFAKGPYARLEGVFVEAVDNRRCQVLIQLLGDTRVASAELAHIES